MRGFINVLQKQNIQIHNIHMNNYLDILYSLVRKQFKCIIKQFNLIPNIHWLEIIKVKISEII